MVRMVIEVRRDKELLVGDLLPAEHLDWDAEAKAEVASGVDQGSVPGLIFHQMLESSGNDRHENRHNRHDGYMMVNIGKHSHCETTSDGSGLKCANKKSQWTL